MKHIRQSIHRPQFCPVCHIHRIAISYLIIFGLLASVLSVSAQNAINPTTLYDQLKLDFESTTLPLYFKKNSASVFWDNPDCHEQIIHVPALTNDLIPLMEKIAKILPKNNKFLVTSYSSSDEENGFTLSRQRADSVFWYIIRHSEMDKNSFLLMGAGPSSPLPDLSPEDPKNCRAVISIISNE